MLPPGPNWTKLLTLMAILATLMVDTMVFSAMRVEKLGPEGTQKRPEG